MTEVERLRDENAQLKLAAAEVLTLFQLEASEFDELEEYINAYTALDRLYALLGMTKPDRTRNDNAAGPDRLFLCDEPIIVQGGCHAG